MISDHLPIPGTPDKAALERIARTLNTIAAELADGRAMDAFARPVIIATGSGADTVASRVRIYLAARRARADVLEGDWFADPAWDLLLDLLANEHEGRRISISSACIASGVPPTTALRWLDRLLEAGIVYRVGDARDRRRSYVGLAPPAAARLEQWVARHLPAIEPRGVANSASGEGRATG